MIYRYAIILVLWVFASGCNTKATKERNKLHDIPEYDQTQIDNLNYLKKLETNGDEYRVSLVRAYILYERGEVVSAENRLNEVLKLNAHQPDACYLKALINYSKGDIDGALKYIQIAVEAGLKATYVDLLLAKLYTEINQPKKALMYLTMRVDDEVRYLKGLNKLKIQDTTNALIELETISLNNSDNIPAMILLSEVYESRGNNRSLTRLLNKVEALDSCNVDVQLKRAGQSVKLNDYKSALAFWRKAHTCDTLNDFRASNKLGGFYFEYGRYDSAWHYLSYDLNDIDSNLVKMKAYSLKSMRRYPEALEYFKKVKQLAPDNLNILAEILYLEQRVNRSKQTTIIPSGTN